MDIKAIVAELEAERDRLNNALAALSRNRATRNGWGRRVRSAAVRKRMSEAQKKRWSERKMAKR